MKSTLEITMNIHSLPLTNFKFTLKCYSLNRRKEPVRLEKVDKMGSSISKVFQGHDMGTQILNE